MKARDVVNGWPRPRTTVARDPFIWLDWPTPLSFQGKYEAFLNNEYHRLQQIMQTAFFERWRTARHPDAFLVVAMNGKWTTPNLPVTLVGLP